MLILSGEKGAGKTLWINKIMEALASPDFKATKLENLTHKFNDVTLNKSGTCTRMIFLDEFYIPWKKNQEIQRMIDLLKIYVTNPEFDVEQKNKSIIKVENRMCLIAATNQSNLGCLWSTSNRRFVMIPVSNPFIYIPGRRLKYFTDLIDALNDTRAVLAWYRKLVLDMAGRCFGREEMKELTGEQEESALKSKDLKVFARKILNKPPETTSMNRLHSSGCNSVLEFLFDELADPRSLLSPNVSCYTPQNLDLGTVYDAYKSFADRRNDNPMKIGLFKSLLVSTLQLPPDFMVCNVKMELETDAGNNTRSYCKLSLPCRADLLSVLFIKYRIAMSQNLPVANTQDLRKLVLMNDPRDISRMVLEKEGDKTYGETKNHHLLNLLELLTSEDV